MIENSLDSLAFDQCLTVGVERSHHILLTKQYPLTNNHELSYVILQFGLAAHNPIGLESQRLGRQKLSL